MKKALFDELTASVREAGRIHRGAQAPSRVFTFPEPDVKRIRQKLKKSQTEFARLCGVKVATLRNWEQGRRRPTGPAFVLLKVAEHNPSAIEEALHVPQGAADL